MTTSTSRRALGWCAALAAGALLLAPTESQAQMFRGGRGWGGGYGSGYGWGGGYRDGWGYGSPGYGYGGWYGNYYSPGYSYYTPGYTYYGTTPYAYNYPYTSMGSVVTPTYSYVNPPVNDTYAQSVPGTTTTTESLYRPAVQPNSARLTVLLPA